MDRDFAEYVHEYRDAHGRAWWVVCQCIDGVYYVGHTKAMRKLTGCHTSFSRDLGQVAGMGYSYRRRQGALRRARLEYGSEAP
jgi:hypothetical protein